MLTNSHTMCKSTPRHPPRLGKTRCRSVRADVGVVIMSHAVVEEVVTAVAGISTQRPGYTQDQDKPTDVLADAATPTPPTLTHALVRCPPGVWRPPPPPPPPPFPASPHPYMLIPPPPALGQRRQRTIDGADETESTALYSSTAPHTHARARARAPEVKR
jgi:hypothetical protein